MEATVRWFRPDLCYGFIVCPEGGDDIFVHFSAIESDAPYRNLAQGERVRVNEVVVGPKGRQAISVVSLEAPTP